jgi:hypothetical protein
MFKYNHKAQVVHTAKATADNYRFKQEYTALS